MNDLRRSEARMSIYRQLKLLLLPTYFFLYPRAYIGFLPGILARCPAHRGPVDIPAGRPPSDLTLSKQSVAGCDGCQQEGQCIRIQIPS
jgi:hypothetical protein